MGQPTDQHAGLTERWSQLHQGLVPSRLVRAWLRPMWTLARPLAAARVPPTAVTVVGVGLAIAAGLLAGRWPLAALALIVAAAVADGLDGAIAVVAGRASRAGAVADAVADRIADTAFALTMWRCGAPAWLAVAAAALSLGQELGRPARVLTVAERPTRVICAMLACLCAALSQASWPPTVCAAVWVGATAVAIGQISS